MLEAVDLSKQFNGTVALERLNLRIDAGEIFSSRVATAPGAWRG